MGPAPYLRRLSLRPEKVPADAGFPFDLPFVRDLDLAFGTAVTFFVGENGSGKSTLVEAIAELCRLPVAGGSRNELSDAHAPHRRSELAPALRASFARTPRDGYFFRAEFLAHFASLLEQRGQDPDFLGDPYARYGGRSLHMRSHGEAFLEVFLGWGRPGIVLMDEPESALSAQRQLTLLAHMAKLVAGGDVQFVVATHSPILLTFPDATILGFDDGRIAPVALEQTAHYQITKGILDAPERYWQHLLQDED
ncbi:MAG: AAA family ATPase [Polyangiaceae bacterium]|nr:AAA family ATPase [Polyangiaceae bacterium]